MTALQKALTVLALLTIALVAAWRVGERHGEAKVQAAWDADKAKQAAALAEAERKAAQVTERVVTQYVDRVQVVHEKGQTLIQKVPVYVSSKADAQCVVPRGFVRVHDAAARQMPLPDPAAGTDDAPSGVALSAVAGTVVLNYSTYYEQAEKLKALQEWARQQAAQKGP